jgi:hypothetical protein
MVVDMLDSVQKSVISIVEITQECLQKCKKVNRTQS